MGLSKVHTDVNRSGFFPLDAPISKSPIVATNDKGTNL
jgi:hypothetical protein